jgi:2-iminoacetate synthase
MNDLCFETAKSVTDKAFGNRVVIFVPLYYSNFCENNCRYCGFGNRHKIERRRLSREELRLEARELSKRGFTGIELVSGKDPFFSPGKVGELIQVCRDEGARTVITNIGAFREEEAYRILKDAGLDVWVLFQETYIPESYALYHPENTPKGNLEMRLRSYELAARAGIRGIGLGVLLGLSSWQHELMAMVDHALFLKKNYEVIVSFSVPRIQPIQGSGAVGSVPHFMSDEQFLGFIALLRMAFPCGAISISTRESREMRKKALSVSGTSTSAESSTSVGGYARSYDQQPQFPVHAITMEETIEDIISIGKLPSFCTACSELGVCGEFYQLAEEGWLREGCVRNAVITYGEHRLREVFGKNSFPHFVYDFKEAGFKGSK